MAWSEFEHRRIEKRVGQFVERRRPPPNLRDQVDFAFRLEKQSVVLFEVRPSWRGSPGESIEQSVAKATYVKARDVWRVYWMRADLKWHGYEPCPEVGNVEAFLRLVDDDVHHCFFG